MNQNIMINAVVVLVLLIGTSYNVSAESGSILISDENTTAYNYPTTTYTTGYQVNFSKFEFLNTSYNYLSNFRITGIGLAYGDYPFTFAHQFESSEFTIVSGGTGDGTIRYDANTTAIYYVFSSSSRVTGKVVELSINNPLFQSNITTAGSVRTSDAPLSTSYPLGMRLIGSGSFIQIRYEDVVYGVRAYDYYQVDYPYTGYFRVNVTKNTDVNTRYIIHSETTNYSAETTYNKDDIVKALFLYSDGLYLNATLASGVYTETLVNSTGTAGYTPPGDQPIVNPITGVGIVFDASEYAVGDIANITWQRTINTPFGYQDLINLYSPGADIYALCWDQPDKCEELIVSPTDSGNVKVLLKDVGTYLVTFERRLAIGAWGGREVLAGDNAVVGAEAPSYVVSPAYVAVGQLFNVTYYVGWTITEGTHPLLRVYHWDDGLGSYSDTFQSYLLTYGVKGIELNTSIMTTHIGRNLIKLCDTIQGCKATTTLESYFNGSVVTTNVSISNISTDKTAYSRGETMIITSIVDNTNWSNKAVTIDYYDADEGITQNLRYVQDQPEVTPYYISDLLTWGSGAAQIRLIGTNSSGVYVLSSTNITLSNVDTEGYGLEILGNKSCVGDIAPIKVITPSGETGNLNISADNVKYNKAYVINGTRTINYKFVIPGTYYITLNVNGEAKRINVLTISDCEVKPTLPGWGGAGTWAVTNDDIAPTCGFWDSCVRGVFPTQGVNDVTRILFALGAIVFIMFCGMIVSKGNFGVSVCLALVPYCFFAYLSMSTPCGTYMPLWVSVFLALVIGIKMKWFT